MKLKFTASVLAISWGMLALPTAADDGPIPHLPAEDATITRIAFGSCADEELPQPIWDAILAADPDLFLFTGDNVYADINQDQWVNEPDIEAIRFAYNVLEERADFNRFRSKVPILATWDDHDYGINDAGVEFPLKAESKQLMMDFFGVPADAPVRSRDGVYQSYSFGEAGKRVQVILLDTRWWRSPLRETDERGAPGKERYVPDPDPAKTILGEEQWAWLEGELQKPADLRLVVTSIQLIADGHGWERWGNLPLERERFYDLLRETGAKNTVLVSGDRHVGGFYRLEGETAYPLYEVTSSSINKSFAAGAIVPEYGPHQMGHLYGPENFGMITIDWPDRILSMDLRDVEGEIVRSVTISLADLRLDSD